MYVAISVHKESYRFLYEPQNKLQEDKLTKIIANSHIIIIFNKISINLITKTLYDKTVELWQVNWNKEIIGRLTTGIPLFQTLGITSYLNILNMIIDLLTITGYRKFNRLFCKFGFRDNNHCDNEKKQDNNLLFDCEKYDNIITNWKERFYYLSITGLTNSVSLLIIKSSMTNW